jgi:micrococcal nuclease
MPLRPRRRTSRGYRWRSRFSLTVLFLIALAFVAARLPWHGCQPPRVDTRSSLSVPAEQGEWRTVERVVDGDTFVLNGGERLRLIGVDTPEVHESEKLRRDAERSGHDVGTIIALGKQASAFTKSLAPPGTQVRLEFDQQPRDRYGRLLAFVWLPDGRMLNETIVCEGYGNAYTRYPFKQEYMDRFRACEHSAREQGRGLWAEDALALTVPAPSAAATGDVRGNQRSKIYHLPNCPNYNDVSPANSVVFTTETAAQEAGYRKAKNCP